MKKPYILAVDDDPAVLRAVERDLKSKFSTQYRILAADSAERAMGFVRQLTSRGDRIALFLVDQRMPLVSGTEFLLEALVLQPAARRVLLTAYAESLFAEALGASGAESLSCNCRSAGRLDRHQS
jgi:thioredoxin reductase (NADPH)